MWSAEHGRERGGGAGGSIAAHRNTLRRWTEERDLGGLQLSALDGELLAVLA
jgi:hypothetical protein